ncbi:MAG TPA: mandelate racemase/muconate lactonizing enzyme family protein [Syntrophorhabdaceae bacterium]|nr:mandelate racemase/muconate lactonizing enzyme family protein [Syntrophorhabdaceae bacterium]
MKITSVDIYQLGRPRDGKTKPFNPLVVVLNTDDGVKGFGEVGLAYGAGSSGGFGMLKDLAYFVLGADPRNVEAIWEKLFRKTFWGMGGGPVVYGAVSGIDTACWDIKAKTLGVPVYELLGGKSRDKVRTYASQIQFDWGPEHKYFTEPEQYAEAALKAVQEGYDCVKVDPVGMTAQGVWGGASLEGILTPAQLRMFYNRTRAIREAVGPDIDIIIEIHSYLGVSSAIQFANAIEDLNCMFYEEPIHPLNVDSMARVARSVRIPLAAGERIYTRWGYRLFFEKQALSVIQPDLGLVGGFTEGKKISDMANVYDVTVQCHVAGGPIATAVALQLEAVIPNFLIHELHAVALQEEVIAMCKYNYVPQQGYFAIPELPGIGQELSDRALKEGVHVRIE